LGKVLTVFILFHYLQQEKLLFLALCICSLFSSVYSFSFNGNV
jgi:hypothetical protein